MTLSGTDKGDVFSRLLLPPPMPAEDPFTGSATGCMAAYIWANRLIDRPNFVAEQGHWIGRPGQAQVEVLGPPNDIAGVRVGGRGAPSAPAAIATLRACRLMCPLWMPSVDKARRAEKFCTNPVAAITAPSRLSDRLSAFSRKSSADRSRLWPHRHVHLPPMRGCHCPWPEQPRLLRS